MPTLKAVLDGLAGALKQQSEVQRFQQAKARIAADPEASKALHAFVTECYARARSAGINAPSPADANWLAARRQVACQNPKVREYLDTQAAVLRLLGTVNSSMYEHVIQPDR